MSKGSNGIVFLLDCCLLEVRVEENSVFFSFKDSINMYIISFNNIVVSRS